MRRPIDQTILHSDPHRPGNCFAACVATAVGRPLEEVPHFVEMGQYLWNGERRSTSESFDSKDADRKCWWALFPGYVGALGLQPELVESHDEAHGELVFVSGLSPRGIRHQVLYLDGELWHDPHPSRAGVDPDGEMWVLRPITYDHSPTRADS